MTNATLILCCARDVGRTPTDSYGIAKVPGLCDRAKAGDFLRHCLSTTLSVYSVGVKELTEVPQFANGSRVPPQVPPVLIKVASLHDLDGM